jgi:hypothetical protein
VEGAVIREHPAEGPARGTAAHRSRPCAGPGRLHPVPFRQPRTPGAIRPAGRRTGQARRGLGLVMSQVAAQVCRKLMARVGVSAGASVSDVLNQAIGKPICLARVLHEARRPPAFF